MTKKQAWFSLAQASLKLERGNTYVSVWLRRHPDELPSEMLMETGKVKLISEDGIEWIKNHIKKEGVLVSNQTTHEDCNLETQLLGFTLSSYYFTILRGGPRGTYQLA